MTSLFENSIDLGKNKAVIKNGGTVTTYNNLVPAANAMHNPAKKIPSGASLVHRLEMINK